MSPLGLRGGDSSSHTSHPMCLSPADLSGKATIVWYFQVGEGEGWDPSKLVCPTWWMRDACLSSTERGGGAQRTLGWKLRAGSTWATCGLQTSFAGPAAFLLWFFAGRSRVGLGRPPPSGRRACSFQPTPSTLAQSTHLCCLPASLGFEFMTHILRR